MGLLPFTVHNPTSNYGIQLPSTVDNFRQHLLHHNTLFVTFSMNELKWPNFILKVAQGGTAQIVFPPKGI